MSDQALFFKPCGKQVDLSSFDIKVTDHVKTHTRCTDDLRHKHCREFTSADNSDAYGTLS